MSATTYFRADARNTQAQDEMAEDVSPVQTGAAGSPATSQDRRRPDRMDEINPALIPLLRDPAGGPDKKWAEFESDLALEADQLIAVKGIALAVAISIISGLLLWRLL